MNLIKTKAFLSVCAASAFLLTARADPIPYPHSGTANAATYTFTAAATGNVNAYFAGSGAGWTEEVEMLVNGVATNSFGLNNQSSSVGQEFDLGTVQAGDTIVFVDYLLNGSYPGQSIYSNPLLNTGAYADQNHIYSTTATAGQAYGGSPAGTYVAFEDEPFGSSDLNYHDDTFVFTNVATQTSGVPDGGTTAVMLGLGMIGLFAARRKLAAA